MPQLFCKDCKHYKAPSCIHPKVPVDPVEGKAFLTAAQIRESIVYRNTARLCGPDGNWFEAIE